MKSWFDAFPLGKEDPAFKLYQSRAINLEQQIKVSIRENSPIQLYVRYNPKDEKSIRSLESSLSKIGKIEYALNYVPCFIMSVEGKDAKNIKDIVSGKRLESIEKKYDKINQMITEVESGFKFCTQNILKPKTVPYQKNQSKWNLAMIGADIATQYSKGQGIKIGVIDTGIDFSHKEFQGRTDPSLGKNFVADEPPIDRQGHGTHVAGICAGETVGVATQADLYALKVLGDDGYGSEANVIKAIEWSIDNKMDIINMSLGSSGATSVFQNICAIAYSKGLILVAAAGNEAIGDSYPAAFGPSVISVAALEKDQRHAEFSNICNSLDISAPGVEIISAYKGGEYCSMTGTSMAAPHVSGCAAIYKSYCQGIDFEEIMKDTAKELKTDLSFPDSFVFGAGLIKIDAMMRYVYDRDLVWDEKNKSKNNNPDKSKKGFIDIDDTIFKSLFPENNFNKAEDFLNYISKKYDEIENKVNTLLAKKRILYEKINNLK